MCVGCLYTNLDNIKIEHSNARLALFGDSELLIFPRYSLS